VQDSALAIAVFNADGLGSLPCTMLTIDAMRKELAAIKAQTTKPYNVNFFCQHSFWFAIGRIANASESLLKGNFFSKDH
jgi:NAD(P)H-dependent flavin oxidoreductase YrpB (nitropropane dioxygenase family)